MNHSATQSFDICIVGGGIVGLTAAALLSKNGLSVALVEQGPAQVHPLAPDRPYSLRVSAINLASMRIFEHLGVAATLTSDRASPYLKMQIWDANSDAYIEFDADSANEEQLGYIIENDCIINALLDLLKDNNNVTIYPDSALSSLEKQPSYTHLKLQQAQIRASLVIGADGQHSAVRQLTGLATESGLFDQTALVCRIQTQNKHQQTAFQCFHHQGPIAYLPLADGSCSIVWSCDTDYAAALRQLDDDAFANAVEQALQSKLGAVTIMSPRGAFVLAQQHASRYVEPGIALIGDAAHRTHPLAGLGANLGLLDAAMLSEVITNALSQQRRFSSLATLRKYERNRKPQNALTLDAMQTFKSGFASKAPGVTALRAMTLNSVNKLTPMKVLISQLATGNRGDLPQICKPPHF